jgi:hypothetical protein
MTIVRDPLEGEDGFIVQQLVRDAVHAGGD